MQGVGRVALALSLLCKRGQGISTAHVAAFVLISQPPEPAAKGPSYKVAFSSAAGTPSSAEIWIAENMRRERPVSITVLSRS